MAEFVNNVFSLAINIKTQYRIASDSATLIDNSFVNLTDKSIKSDRQK